MTARDIVNIEREYRERFVPMESSIEFVKIERTSSGGQEVAFGFDNASYNVWADDTGFTESESATSVPCRIVPSVSEAKNLTQVGYSPDSEIEVELFISDLDRFGISWETIETDYDYVRLDASIALSANGRMAYSSSTLWDITSVRSLQVGDQALMLRIGLRRREVEDG